MELIDSSISDNLTNSACNYGLSIAGGTNITSSSISHALDLQPGSYIEPIYVEENSWKTTYNITCKNTYKFTGLKPMRSYRVTILYARYQIN